MLIFFSPGAGTADVVHNTELPPCAVEDSARHGFGPPELPSSSAGPAAGVPEAGGAM